MASASRFLEAFHMQAMNSWSIVRSKSIGANSREFMLQRQPTGGAEILVSAESGAVMMATISERVPREQSISDLPLDTVEKAESYVRQVIARLGLPSDSEVRVEILLGKHRSVMQWARDGDIVRAWVLRPGRTPSGHLRSAVFKLDAETGQLSDRLGELERKK